MALSFEQILQQALGNAPTAPQQSVGVAAGGNAIVAPEGSEILRPGGPGQAQGIAELMAGGGSASVGGKSIFGSAFGEVDRSALRPGFQQVLEQADALRGSPDTVAAVGRTQAGAAQDPAQLLQALQGSRQSTNFQDVVKEITGAATNVAHREQLQAMAPQLALELIKARTSANEQRFANASPIVKEALRAAGVLPGVGQEAFAKAKGKAEGERAGGKNKGIQGLASAAGSDKFADEFAKVIESGEDIPANTQLALQRLHDQRIKNATPEEKLTTSIQNVDSSIGRLTRVRDAYDKASAKDGGFSQGMKLSLSRTPTFAGLLQGELIPVTEKLTPDEVKFVTESNALLIGMRQMFDDNRMSDQDVQLFLRAIGDPRSTREVFLSQLDATTQTIRDRGQAALGSLTARNKDTRGIVGSLKHLKVAGATPKGVPQGATDTGRTSGGKKVFKAPDGTLHVED